MSIPYKKLKNLPESQNLQDSDITIIEDLDTTRKGTLRQLVQYLKWHNDINTYYAHQENIGAANGIAPLDENTKLPAGNLLFGNEAGTVFEGSAGKELEDSVNVHIADNSRHISNEERTEWNDTSCKKHVHNNKGTLDKLTQTMLDKLADVAEGAQVNVQADWNVSDTSSDAYIKNKPAAFPPSSHTHVAAQISDMPTKLSQFTNDAGYLTSADIDSGQNHTHANKGVLDTITQESVDKWNTSYVHPNSGVSAGTYKSVTVNAQGHVTNGTNPTTLAGYGITDAAAKSHTHNYAGSDTPGGAAASAAKLSANRTISLTGDVSGSVSTNLSGNVSIAATLSGGVLKEAISKTEPSGLSLNNYWLQEY